MNETERLRDEAAKQYLRERAEEIDRYLTGLFNTAEEYMKLSKKAMMVELGSIIILIVSLAPPMPDLLTSAAYLFWIVSMVYHHIVEQARSLAVGKVIGAITMLKKLGYIDDDGIDRNVHIKMKQGSAYKEMWSKVKSIFKTA